MKYAKQSIESNFHACMAIVRVEHKFSLKSFIYGIRNHLLPVHLQMMTKQRKTLTVASMHVAAYIHVAE